MTDTPRPHTINLSTDELDATIKSLMTSVTANTKKRRRFTEGSNASREVAAADRALRGALRQMEDAQSASWDRADR